MAKDILLPFCLFIASAVLALFSTELAWGFVVVGATLMLAGMVALRRKRARIEKGAVVVPGTDAKLVGQAPLITAAAPPVQQPVLRSLSLRCGAALLLGPVVIYGLAAAGLLR